MREKREKGDKRERSVREKLKQKEGKRREREKEIGIG